MRKRLAPLIAAACLLLVPAGASALPADPGFEPLTPADGATLPVSADGIAVSFTCPVYHVADPGFPLFGGVKDYGIRMSTSRALGADGRLAGGTSNTASADPAAADTCVSALGAGGPPPPIQETPGQYFWQVYRICTGCPGSYETGPVRSFTLKSNVQPVLSVPQKAYDEYPFIVSVAAAGAPTGASVVIERRPAAAGSRSRRRA
jgi:hypothetical protein